MFEFNLEIPAAAVDNYFDESDWLVLSIILPAKIFCKQAA